MQKTALFARQCSLATLSLFSKEGSREIFGAHPVAGTQNPSQSPFRKGRSAVQRAGPYQTPRRSINPSTGAALQPFLAWEARQMAFYDSACCGTGASAKNPTASPSSLVLRIGGNLCQMRLPYGFSTSLASQIISTPRSVSSRIRRPAPCLSTRAVWHLVLHEGVAAGFGDDVDARQRALNRDPFSGNWFVSCSQSL